MRYLLLLILCAVSLFAAPLKPKLSKEELSMQRQTTHLLQIQKKYQKKFHLTEMPINMYVVPAHILWEVTGGQAAYGASGTVNGKAVILIMRYEDYPDFSTVSRAKRDQENTVVHELLHLMIRAFSEENVVAIISNQFIHQGK